jgi:outer membrane protein assembly factor BamE (lipoprotein component of BamABCDE complex)
MTFAIAGGFGKSVRAMLVVASVSVVAGCAATTTKHGHHFNDSDLQQVQPGMSQDAVRMALGTPDTTSAVSGNNAYYYISSTTKQTAFFKPDEVDRRIVAVYFNPVGSVERVANYGMKDGQIVDFVKRETPAHMRDKTFLSRFFRGVGPKTKIVDD